MNNIIKRFFGSEETANQLQELDEELKEAIEDIKKLEEDWKEKVKLIRSFINTWNSGHLEELREHIRVVQELDIKEEEKIVKERKAILKIKIVLGKLMNSENNVRHVELLKRLSVNLNQNIYNKNPILKFILFLNYEFNNWKKLEENLQKQLNFINTYYNQDIGVVYFHIKELIGLIKEEGKILGLESKLMKEIANLEYLVKNYYIIQRNKNKVDAARRRDLGNFIKLKQKLAALGLGTALVLGGTSIALGIAELGARSYTGTGRFLLSHNPVIQKQTEGTDFFEADRNYGHVLKYHSFVGRKKLESLDDIFCRVQKSDILVLNLGDSSTSGWNSNIVTENLEIKKAGKPIKSPFFTYPTYSDLLNQETGISAINAGVPGYSSDTGVRYLKDLLPKLIEKGLKPHHVTIYYGNNDSVWNLNVEDKSLFLKGELSHLVAIGKQGYNTILSTLNSIELRVSLNDYEKNLKEMIRIARVYGVKPILIEPVIPKYWQPGLRAEGKGEELEKWKSATYIKAIKSLNLATSLYKEGVAAYNSGNFELARKKFIEAQNLDFIVPRIKPQYREVLQKVARETNTPLISLQEKIPLDDKKFFIDYCHPIEPANRLIANDIKKLIKIK